MELDAKKTKIAQMSEGYKFFGFELRLRIKKSRGLYQAFKIWDFTKAYY